MMWRVEVGDCRELMAAMPEASVDAVVCDPPYELGFMGKSWDASGVAFDPATWAACLRVLKPGGHLLAFGGTRTVHRIACAIEDAGFEVRDMIAWLYGSGFSKSWNFKTMYDGPWCECGNPLSYDHAEQDSEHDLSRLLNADVPPPGGDCAGRREVLLAGVQEQGEPAHGAEDGQPVDDRRVESVMEGRDVHRAGQGIPAGKDARASEGTDERLRAGAHHRGGGSAGPSACARGGSASREPGQGGQQAGESSRVRVAPGTLDGGALRDGGRCARCGYLAQHYVGAGTGLKPAFEPVVVARKPLVGTVAANVLAHGTGALNIDACRIGTDVTVTVRRPGSGAHGIFGADDRSFERENPAGRWPANVILDPDAATMLDQQTGDLPAGVAVNRNRQPGTMSSWMGTRASQTGPDLGYGDSGGASRFFYVAKASRAERNAGLDGFEKRRKAQLGGADREGQLDDVSARYLSQPMANVHPTVKPIELMRHLARLVTPPGGHILDPFTGSGTTGVAAALEGFHFTGCEQSPEYAAIAQARIRFWHELGPQALDHLAALHAAEQDRQARAEQGQLDLFNEAA